jgi:hypothetical protein
MMPEVELGLRDSIKYGDSAMEVPNAGRGTQATDLDRMIRAAQLSGISVDFIAAITQGLDSSCLAILCGNISNLPKYIKSKLIPNCTT